MPQSEPSVAHTVMTYGPTVGHVLTLCMAFVLFRWCLSYQRAMALAVTDGSGRELRKAPGGAGGSIVPLAAWLLFVTALSHLTNGG